MKPVYYHGGVAGLVPGDVLVPSPAHQNDGCPICDSRARGEVFTALMGRTWATQLGGERGARMLAILEGAPDDEVIDAPTGLVAVYITVDLDYATWYAARSGHGDLYEVAPTGPVAPAEEDHFALSYVVPSAVVVRVLRRGVRLDRRERRRINRRWLRADLQRTRSLQEA